MVLEQLLVTLSTAAGMLNQSVLRSGLNRTVQLMTARLTVKSSSKAAAAPVLESSTMTVPLKSAMTVMKSSAALMFPVLPVSSSRSFLLMMKPTLFFMLTAHRLQRAVKQTLTGPAVTEPDLAAKAAATPAVAAAVIPAQKALKVRLPFSVPTEIRY